MNNNCQGYDFSMESLLLHCNKPFHFYLKDTQITFHHLLKKRHIDEHELNIASYSVMSGVQTKYQNVKVYQGVIEHIFLSKQFS